MVAAASLHMQKAPFQAEIEKLSSGARFTHDNLSYNIRILSQGQDSDSEASKEQGQHQHDLQPTSMMAKFTVQMEQSLR